VRCAFSQRERWGSRIAFLFAAIGAAVGLGNLWRFPVRISSSSRLGLGDCQVPDPPGAVQGCLAGVFLPHTPPCSFRDTWIWHQTAGRSCMRKSLAVRAWLLDSLSTPLSVDSIPYDISVRAWRFAW
jgi:hypothetical protein